MGRCGGLSGLRSGGRVGGWGRETTTFAAIGHEPDWVTGEVSAEGVELVLVKTESGLGHLIGEFVHLGNEGQQTGILIVVRENVHSRFAIEILEEHNSTAGHELTLADSDVVEDGPGAVLEDPTGEQFLGSNRVGDLASTGVEMGKDDSTGLEDVEREGDTTTAEATVRGKVHVRHIATGGIDPIAGMGGIQQVVLELRCIERVKPFNARVLVQLR